MFSRTDLTNCYVLKAIQSSEGYLTGIDNKNRW